MVRNPIKYVYNRIVKKPDESRYNSGIEAIYAISDEIKRRSIIQSGVEALNKVGALCEDQAAYKKGLK